jgi:GNAT superfamily N-acetyltransferase
LETADLNNVKIGPASETDISAIIGLIKELAEYEKLSDLVLVTENDLRKWMFDERKLELLICKADGVPIGFASLFYNFSTFLGRPGLYMEDLYIKPDARGRGIGRYFISYIANLAVERGCARLDWACLNWNSPSIAFYHSMGAKEIGDWVPFRIAGNELEKLASSYRTQL